MGSKRKIRKALKAVSKTHVPEKSPRQTGDFKPSSAEALIKHNGDLIESLISHQGWQIIEELLDEGIASVVGRKTNGYYYDGALNNSTKNKDYLTGYKEALTQFYNRVKDFILVRDKLSAIKKQEEIDSKAPVYNPFLENDDG